MSLIQRPIKHNGTRTYVTEVAIQPNDPILDNEVDGDFDTMYADYNGHIVDANIDPAAGISTAKIAPDGHLVSAHLDPAAGIKGAQLADQPNGVTTGKINIGATTPNRVTVVSMNPAAGFGTGQHDVAVLPSITTRGGAVLLLGDATLVWQGGSGATATVLVRVFRDGVQISGNTMPLAQTAGNTYSVAVPCPSAMDANPPAGAHVYKYTVEVLTNGQVIGFGNGMWSAVELA